MKQYSIPVTWSVSDKVVIEAESLEEAVQFVKDHIEEIPLGMNPEYIDGSYQIDDGSFGEKSVQETAQYLRDYYYWKDFV